MTMAAIGAAVAGAAVTGAMAKGGGGGGGSSQKQELDPRIQGLLFGGYDQGGLLGDANNLYRSQSATGGLNPWQTAGLEGQRQFLTSDGYTQGYDAMRNLGLGLLGGGVASNPFTSSTPKVAPNVGAYKPFSYSPTSSLMGASDSFDSLKTQTQPSTLFNQNSQLNDDIIKKYLLSIGIIPPGTSGYGYEYGNGDGGGGGGEGGSE